MDPEDSVAPQKGKKNSKKSLQSIKPPEEKKSLIKLKEVSKADILGHYL